MKNTLYKTYENKKPCGTFTLCNFGGLVLYNPVNDDYYKCDFITAWDFGGKPYNFHRSNVHYTTSGRGYITKGNRRYYLDQIMRV